MVPEFERDEPLGPGLVGPPRPSELVRYKAGRHRSAPFLALDDWVIEPVGIAEVGHVPIDEPHARAIGYPFCALGATTGGERHVPVVGWPVQQGGSGGVMP
jgi:hypothetical protein